MSCVSNLWFFAGRILLKGDNITLMMNTYVVLLLIFWCTIIFFINKIATIWIFCYDLSSFSDVPSPPPLGEGGGWNLWLFYSFLFYVGGNNFSSVGVRRLVTSLCVCGMRIETVCPHEWQNMCPDFYLDCVFCYRYIRHGFIETNALIVVWISIY